MDNETFKTIQAYRKQCRATGEACIEPNERSGPAMVNGRRFITLRCDNGIFAVYSWRDGDIRRLKERSWPPGID